MVSNKSVIKNNFLKSKTHATPTEDRQLTRTLALLLLLDTVRTNHGSRMDVNEDQENGMMNAENIRHYGPLRNKVLGTFVGLARCVKNKALGSLVGLTNTISNMWNSFPSQSVIVRKMPWLQEAMDKFQTWWRPDQVMERLKEVVLAYEDKAFLSGLKKVNGVIKVLSEDRQAELVNAMIMAPDNKGWSRLLTLMKMFPNKFNSYPIVMGVFRRLLKDLDNNEPKNRHTLHPYVLTTVLSCIERVPGLEKFSKENHEIINCIEKLIADKPETGDIRSDIRAHEFYTTLDTMKDLISYIPKTIDVIPNKKRGLKKLD